MDEVNIKRGSRTKKQNLILAYLKYVKDRYFLSIGGSFSGIG